VRRRGITMKRMVTIQALIQISDAEQPRPS
jgi:hypothetical protein